jgi:hypothetical protein
MLVAMMAGWAFCVAVSRELGPSAMILERLQFSVESISSRMGLQVLGKAESQSWVMPTRCTPWPGKKRAVRGRRGLDVVVALWRVCGCELVVVYIEGRRVDGRERRVVGCGCCEARRRAERDMAVEVV